MIHNHRIASMLARPAQVAPASNRPLGLQALRNFQAGQQGAPLAAWKQMLGNRQATGRKGGSGGTTPPLPAEALP